MLLNDGETCVEINECTLNADDCQQVCVNTEGGFQCECFEGYMLNDDQKNCSGLSYDD